MGYNTNNKVITICLIFMVCCSGLIECRPTLMNLGSIHMKLKAAAGKRKAVGQSLNDINEQQGNKQHSPTFCYTRIKYDTKNICFGDVCRDVTISKTVRKCIAI